VKKYGDREWYVEFSDAQDGFVKDTLAQNPDVRWTFLFLHEPAWAF
jgi:hypothetical protein